MPLVRIDLRRGKPPAYRKALCEGVYCALRETFNVPEDDQFMTIREHGDSDLRYGATYLGIARTDDIVLIQITANNTRTVDQKKAFFRQVADNLAANPGVRKEDIFLNLVEVLKENWSFGNGIAQYAADK